jgi:hypothetical protein
MRSGIDLVTIVLLVLATLLIGVGRLAVLPPFEGIDEVGHYSSIRQIADTGTIPVLGSSYVGQDVVDYYRHSPRTYTFPKILEHADSKDKETVIPPEDSITSLNKGKTYMDFLTDPGSTDYYRKTYREPKIYASFTPSRIQNWQAQHPPLYYLMMAPIMKATDSLPFVTQFFVLRLVSFLLAFSGLMVGLYGSLAGAEEGKRKYVAAAFLLYPLMVPMFYVEFGRLGNDSLCLFLMGIIWALLMRWVNDEHNTKRNLALGACFGLGLLSKAFFLPVLAGFGLFLVARLWRDRSDKKLVKERMDDLTLFFVPSFVAALGLMFYLKTYGPFAGGLDFIIAHRDCKLISVITEINVFSFLRGLTEILVTWSTPIAALSKDMALFAGAPFLLILWFIALYLLKARKHSLTEPIWLPVWLSAPMIGGLIYHLVLSLGSWGASNTPGWYLNILAPAIAITFAHGMKQIEQQPVSRWILKGLLLGAILYLVVSTWSRMALYAGCMSPDLLGVCHFSNSLACFSHFPAVMARLGVMGWPMLGAAGFVCGLICLGVGIFRFFWLAKPLQRYKLGV